MVSDQTSERPTVRPPLIFLFSHPLSLMPTLYRFIIHGTSEGKPHTATWDHYTRQGAEQGFLENARMLFKDTVINSVDELGPVDALS